MNLAELARRLASGEISLAEWQAAMREFIRVTHRQAAIIAAGGAENMTPALWGYEGYLVKLQYQFLDGFVADIAANPLAWSEQRLLYRMRLYQQAEWGTFESIVQRIKQMQGYTEERRVRVAGDSCVDCIEYENRGWQPIGTLPRLGDSVCVTNCRCSFEYRKASEE